MHDRDEWLHGVCGTGDCQYLPKFELWTHLDLPYSCEWQTQVWADWDTKVTFFYAERASRTMEMVTVRQLISNCAMETSSFFLDQNLTEWIFFPTRPCAIVFVISLGSGRLSIPMSMATYVVKFTETMQTLACYWWDHCSVIHSLLFDVFLLYICHFIL